MALIPADVAASPTTHDLQLANNLGFIYTPLLGCWSAWVRRSIPWAIFGVLSGLAIGAAYYLLCGTNFLAVMVGFPCVLGGATSVLLGTKHSSWYSGIVERFAKGVLAGFVLGILYMVILNILFIFTTPNFPYTSPSQHPSGMWTAGTAAMTISSAVYFLLFH